MKNFKKIVALTLVAASLISTVAFASTTTTITDTSIKDSVGQHQRGPKLGLDEDTKAVVDKMKADGATREEIGEYLVSQGYELPEMPHARGPMGQKRGTRPAGQNKL